MSLHQLSFLFVDAIISLLFARKASLTTSIV
nr:MAG TPA: hypothetical protein [Caudoviricetes sp.]